MLQHCRYLSIGFKCPNWLLVIEIYNIGKWSDIVPAKKYIACNQISRLIKSANDIANCRATVLYNVIDNDHDNIILFNNVDSYFISEV